MFQESVVPTADETTNTEPTELETASVAQKNDSDNANDTVSSSSSLSLRVRVINSESSLSKDLLVEIRSDRNVFDVIYDAQAVKKAKVRKWNPAVTQKVKRGTHEIRCSATTATVTNIDDDDDDDDETRTRTRTHNYYSIDDMKQTSTKQLYQKVIGAGSGPQLLTLTLHCVERQTQKPQAAAKAKTTTTASIMELMHNQHFQHPPPNSSSSSGDGSSGPVLRCPFSGIAFDESALLQFLREKDKDKTNNTHNGNKTKVRVEKDEG